MYVQVHSLLMMMMAIVVYSYSIQSSLKWQFFRDWLLSNTLIYIIQTLRYSNIWQGVTWQDTLFFLVLFILFFSTFLIAIVNNLFLVKQDKVFPYISMCLPDIKIYSFYQDIKSLYFFMFLFTIFKEKRERSMTPKSISDRHMFHLR